MDVLCVGEALADILVYPVNDVDFDNKCITVDNIILKTGGDSFNNSVNLSKLGNRVHYVGRIGNDVIGEYIVKEGEKNKIDMSHVVYSETPHTKMNILVNHKGDRAFRYFPGASSQLCFEDIDLSLLKECRLLLIGGTFHLPNLDGEGATRLLRAAKNNGLITAMDVTNDLSGRWDEIINTNYAWLDYFLPSTEQAECITGFSDERRIADYFLERGVKNVLVKLGEKGSYFKNGMVGFHCNCYSVPVIETTGAGDSFVSGFLTGVLKEYPIEKCVQLGTACAAKTIQCLGASAGITSLDDVEEFIKNNASLNFTYD